MLPQIFSCVVNWPHPQSESSCVFYTQWFSTSIYLWHTCLLTGVRVWRNNILTGLWSEVCIFGLIINLFVYLGKRSCPWSQWPPDGETDPVINGYHSDICNNMSSELIRHWAAFSSRLLTLSVIPDAVSFFKIHVLSYMQLRIFSGVFLCLHQHLMSMWQWIWQETDEPHPGLRYSIR